MKVLTLTEAVEQRLADRNANRDQQAESKNQRVAEQVAERATQLANVAEAFKEWMRDTICVALPDDLMLLVGETKNPKAFSIRISLFMAMPNSPIVALAGAFLYSDVGWGPYSSPQRWYAQQPGGRWSYFGDFVDAVIFAIGGERRLRAIGAIRQ